MKFAELVLASGLALAVTGIPVSGFAQPKAVDIVGHFNLADGSGTAVETATGCRYVIDPASGIGASEMTFHPAPPQPTSCKVLVFPDATTFFATAGTVADPNSEIDTNRKFNYSTAVTDCVTAGAGILTEGTGLPGVFPAPTADTFRMLGSEDLNPNNLAQCKKMTRR